MVTRGEIYWHDLGEPVGSAPAKRRPVLVVQSDDYNDTRLQTTVVVALTSNTALSTMPGNVFLDAALSGLPKDSVANVTGSLSTSWIRLIEGSARSSRFPSDLPRFAPRTTTPWRQSRCPSGQCRRTSARLQRTALLW